jgi:hypothetical protein
MASAISALASRIGIQGHRRPMNPMTRLRWSPGNCAKWWIIKKASSRPASSSGSTSPYRA